MHTNSIISLQKKSLKFISNSNSQRSICLFKKFKIPKFNDTYRLHLSILMFKAFYNLLPINIQKNYSRTQTGRVTRQSQLNLNVKIKSTNIQNRKPSIAGPFLWNALQASIRSVTSLNNFKIKVRQYLTSSY